MDQWFGARLSYRPVDRSATDLRTGIGRGLSREADLSPESRREGVRATSAPRVWGRRWLPRQDQAATSASRSAVAVVAVRAERSSRQAMSCRSSIAAPGIIDREDDVDAVGDVIVGQRHLGRVIEQDRALNFPRIATDLRAPVVRTRLEPTHFGGVAKPAPDGGVLGSQPQHHAFAGAAIRIGRVRAPDRG